MFLHKLLPISPPFPLVLALPFRKMCPKESDRFPLMFLKVICYFSQMGDAF